jgi:diguanylate cyclase (GGDEF)-like protein
MPIGKALELYGGASGSKFAARISSALERGDTAVFKGDIRMKMKNGAEKMLLGRAAPMKGSDSEVLGFVAIFRDVTEQQQKEAEILYLSYHDLLTGLYNRNFFEEELRRLDTERQLPLSIIMGDANNLKLVNDVFGHREGDELLKAMAKVLRDSCRTEDIISRWGGDEFTILLPRTDADHAAMICRRIQTKCRECCTADHMLHPSISLGFETKLHIEIEVAHVIKAAEDMMYKNKLLDSRTAHNDFLQSMRDRMGENDLETERHTGRLSELCVRTGRELSLRDDDLADLKILAMLHDIGKAAIDPRILNKPGDLTGDEWEEIKRHSGIGYRIVRSAPELMLVADYILGHHERWDGEGYPQRLKGEHIPLASRILAVADAFDVMTQGRPYREALNQETALMEIFRNAGTQFDPEVVIAFASVLNSLTDELK